MKIIQLQMAFFYDASTVIDFDGMSYFIRQSFKKHTGVDLTINQMLGVLPADAPSEIPRLQLTSLDNKWRVQSSLLRSDVFIERKETEDEVSLDLFKNIFDDMIDVHNNLQKEIIRVGLVAFKAELNDNPNKDIVKSYLNNTMIAEADGLEDVSLMYNQKFEYESSNFNCHFAIMTGYDVVRQRPMLVKQIDVNSFENIKFTAGYSPEKIKMAFLNKINNIQ